MSSTASLFKCPWVTDGLVEAIIQLNKNFGLATVAEGIEEERQAERLATLG